jgi:hypothetical protein
VAAEVEGDGDREVAEKEEKKKRKRRNGGGGREGVVAEAEAEGAAFDCPGGRPGRSSRCRSLREAELEEGDAVPGMKLTLNAAMRARDVSRPHPEHIAEAEAAETAEARAPGSPAPPGEASAAPAGEDRRAARAGFPRRRRGPRDGRGRTSR